MAADNPKSNKADDQLDRYPFAEQIVNGLLTSYENGSESLIIGINGAWGMGKSTLLNFIKTELKDKGIIFDFNPWLFSGQEQLQRKFFKELKLKISFWAKLQEKSESAAEGIEKVQEVAELIKEIGEYTNGLLGKIGYGLSYLEEITGILNENLGKAVGNTAKLMQGEEAKEKPINEIKEAIDKSLKKLDKKIYVFIDDLDRLSPTEITQIFQLIRLNANFANTVFFVAFDKEIVVNALQKEYQKNGENYLEKIIQVDYSLPEISPSKINEILFEKELKKYLQTLDIQEFNEIIKEIRSVWSNGLIHYFKNLRDINRYINAIKLRLPSIYQEIDIADFLVLEAIRIFDYKTYEYIYKNKELLTEFIDSKKYRGDNLAKDYTVRIKDNFALHSFVTGSQNLVEKLFYLANKDSNFNYFGFNRNIETQPFTKFSISVTDNFDRYFTFKLFDYETKKEEVANFINGTVSQKVEVLKKIIDKNLFYTKEVGNYTLNISKFNTFILLINKNIRNTNIILLKDILQTYFLLAYEYQFELNYDFVEIFYQESLKIAESLSYKKSDTIFFNEVFEANNSFLKFYLLDRIINELETVRLNKSQCLFNNIFPLQYIEQKEVEIQKHYKNCLEIIGSAFFDKFIYQKDEVLIGKEFYLLYLKYANHCQEIFETKIKLLLKESDSTFLIFMQAIILNCCPKQVSILICINLSEKYLFTPLNKDSITERFRKVNLSEITDDQQRKTYKFLEKVIEEGFKENVYYNFDTLEELPFV